MCRCVVTLLKLKHSYRERGSQDAVKMHALLTLCRRFVFIGSASDTNRTA